MAIAVGILSMIVSVFSSLMMLVMLLAGSPNSSAAQFALIKRCMWSVVIVCVVALIGSIWLLVAGKPWWSAGVGIGPTVYVIVLFIVLLITSSP